VTRLAEAGELGLEARHVLAERRDPAGIDAVEHVPPSALGQPGSEDGNHPWAWSVWAGGLSDLAIWRSGALCILPSGSCPPPPRLWPCSWRVAPCWSGRCGGGGRASRSAPPWDTWR